MKVWCVQEIVDLGCHTRSVWTDEDFANDECKILTTKHQRNNPEAGVTEPFFVEEFELDNPSY